MSDLTTPSTINPINLNGINFDTILESGFRSKSILQNRLIGQGLHLSMYYNLIIYPANIEPPTFGILYFGLGKQI